MLFSSIASGLLASLAEAAVMPCCLLVLAPSTSVFMRVVLRLDAPWSSNLARVLSLWRESLRRGVWCHSTYSCLVVRQQKESHRTSRARC
eukprot:4121815-Amphidinium_carterae.1